MRLVEEHGGESVVLTLGPADAHEQLRDAMAIGVSRAIHLVTDGEEWDPEATAAAIVEAVRADEAGERPVRPDPLRQRVGRHRRLPGRGPRRTRARPAGPDRPQGRDRRGRRAALRAGGRRRARRLRGSAARGRQRPRGPQPAALPVGPGPDPGEEQARGGVEPGTAGPAPRDGPPRRAAGRGEAGDDPRQRRSAAAATVDLLDRSGCSRWDSCSFSSRPPTAPSTRSRCRR